MPPQPFDDADDTVKERVYNEYKREGNLYAGDGNFAVALFHFSQALKYTNNDSHKLCIIHDLMSQCQLQLEDYSSAVTSSEKSLFYDAGFTEGYLQLARCLRESGVAIRALEMYNKYLDTIAVVAGAHLPAAAEVAEEVDEMKVACSQLTSYEALLAAPESSGLTGDELEVVRCKYHLMMATPRTVVNSMEIARIATQKAGSSISNGVYIRRAIVDDVGALVAFGKDGFSRQFSHLYPPKQLEIFLSEGYTTEKYSTWVTNSEFDVFVSFASADGPQSGALLGYALSGPCHLPHAEVTPACKEIMRFYVDRNVIGKGVSQLVHDGVCSRELKETIGQYARAHLARRLQR